MDHERMRRLHGGKSGGMKLTAFDIVFKDSLEIADRTLAFVFEKPAGFGFRAGQHVRMTLIDPDERDTKGNSRFFSIASTPQDDDLVFAMRMRDTAFKRVLGRMQPGGKVRIEMLIDVPHGAFALHEDASRPAVMLCGGIGIVPAYSMIRDATQRRLPHRIILFYSNHRPQDAAYLTELQDLARQNPGFTLVATTTALDAAPGSGEIGSSEVGRIDRAMLDRYVPNLKAAVWYVAGLPGMVHAMAGLLGRAGVRKSNIKAETFAGFTGEIHKMAGHSSEAPMLGIGVVVLIAAAVALHLGAAAWVFRSGLDVTRLKGPVLYAAVAVGAGLVLLKLWLLHRSGRSRPKN